MSRTDDHMFVNVHVEIFEHCPLLQVPLKVHLGSIVEMYYHFDNLLPEMRIVEIFMHPLSAQVCFAMVSLVLRACSLSFFARMKRIYFSKVDMK